MRELVIELPFPPTLNTYWRHVGLNVLISAEGRRYRKRVGFYVLKKRMAEELTLPMLGRLGLQIEAHPPDKRQRDLDNLPKAIQDSLQAAGVYQNDFQIDDLHEVFLFQHVEDDQVVEAVEELRFEVLLGLLLDLLLHGIEVVAA